MKTAKRLQKKLLKKIFKYNETMTLALRYDT